MLHLKMVFTVCQSVLTPWPTKGYDYVCQKVYPDEAFACIDALWYPEWKGLKQKLACKYNIRQISWFHLKNEGINM